MRGEGEGAFEARSWLCTRACPLCLRADGAVIGSLAPPDALYFARSVDLCSDRGARKTERRFVRRRCVRAANSAGATRLCRVPLRTPHTPCQHREHTCMHCGCSACIAARMCTGQRAVRHIPGTSAQRVRGSQRHVLAPARPPSAIAPTSAHQWCTHDVGGRCRADQGAAVGKSARAPRSHLPASRCCALRGTVPAAAGTCALAVIESRAGVLQRVCCRSGVLHAPKRRVVWPPRSREPHRQCRAHSRVMQPRKRLLYLRIRWLAAAGATARTPSRSRKRPFQLPI